MQLLIWRNCVGLYSYCVVTRGLKQSPCGYLWAYSVTVWTPVAKTGIYGLKAMCLILDFKWDLVTNPNSTNHTINLRPRTTGSQCRVTVPGPCSPLIVSMALALFDVADEVIGNAGSQFPHTWVRSSQQAVWQQIAMFWCEDWSEYEIDQKHRQ